MEMMTSDLRVLDMLQFVTMEGCSESDPLRSRTKRNQDTGNCA